MNGAKRPERRAEVFSLSPLGERAGVRGLRWLRWLIGVVAMLLVLGIGLGYARVASGGVLLPMAMHFVHNAVVIAVEWKQWPPIW